MEKEYAQALNESIKRGTDEAKLVAGLVAHLKEEGRTKLLPGIVRELKALEARNSKLDSIVEVASEAEATNALKEAAVAGISATETRINPSLVRGWRARKGSVLIDRSAKQALVDLYQRITN